MFSYSNYWDRSSAPPSRTRFLEYDQSLESKEIKEETYSTSRESRARSVSPVSYDRGARSFSVMRSELDLGTPERTLRAVSLPPSEVYHYETPSTSSKPSSYQVLSSHDVLSKPFHRSFYYIKPRPDTPVHTPRAYSTIREESVPRGTSVAREGSVLRDFRPISHHYEPRSLLSRESPYGGRYFTRQYSPFVNTRHYCYCYPYVSSSLFIPRYYPGALTVPYILAASRLHI